jgi:uncharacterized RDD family membrane protein YckC
VGGAAPPPQAPSAPQVQAATGIGQPADLLTRFLAKLIDGILLGVAYSIVVVTIVFGAIFSAASGGFGFGTGRGYLASLVGSIVTVAIFLGYYAFMESSRGQTVGKMLVKIEVRGPDGGRPTLEQAVKRNIYFAASLLGIVPIIGGLLSSVASIVAVVMIAVTINSNTATRQGWHDEFAGGTSVIKIG